MPEFRVRWEIDVEADTEAGAAVEAFAIQRDPESIATAFDVFRQDGTIAHIDLRSTCPDCGAPLDVTPAGEACTSASCTYSI